MLGFFGKKSKSRQSALSGQRPRKRRAKTSSGESSPAGVPLAAKFAIVVILAILIGIGVSRSLDFISNTYDRVATVLQGPSKHWEVQIGDGDGTPLSDELRKDIYRIAGKTLRSGTSTEFSSLLSGIEALGTLEQVSIVRPRYQSIVITASTRKPAMLVLAAGKTRFLTQDASVYGDVGETPPANLVTLSGVFDARISGFQFDHSMRLITTSEEKSLLFDGLHLSKLSTKQSLDVKTVNHQGYRGFALILSDGTEVVLGQAPFEYKLEKLLSILGKLKSQGTTASRIELDYDGKAFIKERKL